MADSYFAGFDLIIRDTDGLEIPLANYTLTIAFGATEIEVESDENGFVWAELLTDIPPDSEIEIFDGAELYDGVLNQITKATALDAAIENKINRFIIEDNYATTSETEFLDIYIQDLSDASLLPQYVGTVRPGETFKMPFESAKLKNLRIYKVQRDAEGIQSETEVLLSDYVDFNIDSIIPEAEDEITIDVTAIGGGNNGDILYNNDAILGGINLGLLTERIVVSYEINLNSASEQIAYTVPAGLEFILSKYFYLKPSEDVTGSAESVSILDRDGTPIIATALGSSGLDAVNKYLAVRVDDAVQIYAESETVNFLMSGTYGSAATMKVDIFGYFKAIEIYILDGGASGTSFGGEITDGGDANDTFTDIIDGGTA